MEMDFKHLAVEFFMDAVHNPRKSAEEGRAIFDNVEKVKIRIAGDKQTVHVAPAHEGSSVRDPQSNSRLTYAQLHAGPYEAFKRGQSFIGSGTPLAELPFVTMAKRRELEAANIFTAESFAELDGTNLQKLGMGARELRDQVRAYLDKAKGNVDVVRLSGENEALKAQMEKMQAQLAMLMSGTSPASLPATEVTLAEPVDVSQSPFYDWDDETIKLWIVEQGGENPHHKCSHDTLVRKADELNVVLSKGKAA